MRPFVAATLLVLGLPACSSADDTSGVLEDRLAAQIEAQDALRERVDELEGRLESVQPGDSGSELRELEDRLATLAETVADIQSDLAAGDTAGEDLAGQVATIDDELGQLAQTLSALSSQVQQVRDDTSRLRTDLEQHTGDQDAHGDG